MSRDIKFRAWCTKHKVMTESGKIDNVTFVPGVGLYVNHDAMCVKNEILMQYTGLKDKNGKEIYEGDIVSMFYDTQSSEVGWSNKFGCWEIKVQLSIHSSELDLLGNHIEQCEVIGNIYEDIELLEVSNE